MRTVSSHAPAKGATGAGAFLHDGVKFQVMPPRRGQQKYKRLQIAVINVSSHAPAKGATASTACGGTGR